MPTKGWKQVVLVKTVHLYMYILASLWCVTCTTSNQLSYDITVGQVLIARSYWLRIASFSTPRNQRLAEKNAQHMFSFAQYGPITHIQLSIVEMSICWYTSSKITHQQYGPITHIQLSIVEVSISWYTSSQKSPTKTQASANVDKRP